MGRHTKTVLTVDSLDRRATGYYSTPPVITEFITEELLSRKPAGQTVLDPCVGRGEMAYAFTKSGKVVTGWDIEDFGVNGVATYEKKDFLWFYSQHLRSRILNQPVHLPYDYYVANPPYNCHESAYIRQHKTLLKSTFPRVGVANMYSMFISGLVDIAKPGAILGILTNDSFLTSRLHHGLRLQLLQSCRITHLLLCPVDLFHSQGADVRTCIIILVKEATELDYCVAVLNRPNNTAAFTRALRSRQFDTETIGRLILNSPYDRDEFVVGCPHTVRELFALPRLGQQFRCVTGISTGDDATYLRDEPDAYHTIPFYKNPGSRRFYTEPDAYLPRDFLDIEKKVRTFMVRNKDLLFEKGITCSSMGIPFGACELPANATYGVNANIFCPEDDRLWLLAYLNSSLVTYFVRGVLLRTNMITSGYVSRIPLVPISRNGKWRLSKLAREAVASKIGRPAYAEVMSDIDTIIFDESKLSTDAIRHVVEFRQQIMRAT